MMKNKKVVIAILIFLIICVSIIGGLLYLKEKEFEVILKNDLIARANEKVTNYDFVNEVKKGSILSKKEIIDTSTLGKKKVTLNIKNKFGKKFEYVYYITVIDDEAPVITYNKNIEIYQNEEIDLLKDVQVVDNIDKDLVAIIEGEYDLKKVGVYKIYYVAEDKSGNKTKEEAILTVKEVVPPVVESPSPTEQNPVITPPPSNKFTTSKGFVGEKMNGVTYIDGVLVVNKTYSIPDYYGSRITPETLSAFETMKTAAANEGLNIYISSGFRSFQYQTTIYNNYVNRDGKTAADTYSARPGHSEHQTGLAFDLNTISSEFANTKEGKWLNSNAYKYGFILRYPEGKTNETGYIYEPWHFRYVGNGLAEKLYNNGNWRTLEEYFGITSQYSY